MDQHQQDPSPDDRSELVEAIDSLLSSEGWAVVAGRLERALYQAKGRTERDEGIELHRAQGECRAYRAALGFPAQLKAEAQ